MFFASLLRTVHRICVAMKSTIVLILVLAASLFPPMAMCEQRPGCLPTDPGSISWTLPITPSGPVWTLSTADLQLGDGMVNAPYLIEVWRRPCSSTDAQVLATVLPIGPAVPAINVSTFNVNQGGANYALRAVINSPASFYQITLGSILFVPVTAIVDPVTPNGFDPNGAMTLSISPVVPFYNPTPLSLTIPRYDPSQYGLGPAQSGVNLNQRGLSGTWYNPLTPGQGLVIDISPDQDSEVGILFGGWYTFDTDAGHSQRWYTLQGQVTAASRSASVPVYFTRGGAFDAPGNPTTDPVGRVTLSFSDCDHGNLTYTFSDGSGRTGAIPLTRLLGNPTCEQ